ncbi:pyruvate formate lyase activating enzyme [Flavobacterium glycines]|uniref:Anaerobic ribonucleoside-triphosphate reductase activating protein n=1 Tax=Flavobacterium glycines TaxID=551990 RepID=A0A1B9DR53_9FLAO|nr:anaerobic ribonucleoside-triphosphate reductase activating protein [Flavobacterium glycines]OCB72168.1 anaerobic ribonucleoside-triphosphate reductase activating protein [Flavobacterium glycines]GEL09619.1 anaerobic ribonucleoside-triphosphate reductase activating protein [Flavobacterium glycines]SDJ00136.1 pyruvate formate lyase activating enzyme [Flavobacterium glycines]
MKENVSTPIYSITPFTLLDYAHQSACILWFAGCNMRCLYCYNPEIVLGKGSISFEKTLAFLHSRKKLLDAVVFSGGECLLHKNIIELIIEVKKMGFLVKIDTNGSKPNILKTLIEKQLIDYVALDFKTLPEHFEKITQSLLFSPFEKSLHLLLESPLPFEVRTTVHSELLTEKDIQQMIVYLEKKNYTGNYYIQHFVNDIKTLGKLGHSFRELDSKKLSTPKINVHFRG